MESTNTGQANVPPASLENAGQEFSPGTGAMMPEQALEMLMRDPVGFVQQIVNRSAEAHLANLKEEAELRGAMNLFRRKNPDFERFEPFILQEVAALIQNDPDGVIDPWDKLLEKAGENFRKKFAETLKAEVMDKTMKKEEKQPPYMESAANKALPEQPQSFSREQIDRMSLDEFMKNEAAINDALKNKRIR